MSSSKFETALKAQIADEKTLTENGAVGYKTTGRDLLDLNFAASSLRSVSEDEIASWFSKAFYSSPLYAVKWLFMLRDVRGSGMGERRTFRACFKWLAETRPEIANAVVGLVPEYGRWDDLVCMLECGNVADKVVAVVDGQITKDLSELDTAEREGRQPRLSLLAKWMPSENTSSQSTRRLARLLMSKLSIDAKRYRKTLSRLRKALNVVETKTSANKWGEIDYETVPSKANLVYKDAFLKHDEIRRKEYLGKLTSGEAKINSSTAFPCDIVSKYAIPGSWRGGELKEKDETLEAMWKALPDYTGPESGSTIVVADGSGSMTCPVGGSSGLTALDVANSLAVYFSERLKSEYRNKYITFSYRPQFVDFSNAESLYEKIKLALSYCEVANTNIEGVFDLLLSTAVSAKLEQKDIPANVLIVSDMEFDYATTASYGAADKALFETIERKWRAAGYTLPRLVFWNVASRSGTIPVKMNENGVALVSGFSPAIAKMVFSSKTDPWDVLVETLDLPRYAAVEKAVESLALAR